MNLCHRATLTYLSNICQWNGFEISSLSTDKFRLFPAFIPRHGAGNCGRRPCSSECLQRFYLASAQPFPLVWLLLSNQEYRVVQLPTEAKRRHCCHRSTASCSTKFAFSCPHLLLSITTPIHPMSLHRDTWQQHGGMYRPIPNFRSPWVPSPPSILPSEGSPQYVTSEKLDDSGIERSRSRCRFWRFVKDLLSTFSSFIQRQEI
jgi:hypothetical protein